MIILILILFSPGNLHADEFKILSFQKAEGEITAINQRYKRLDDNDLTCAIIKVRSDIQGLGFEASNPIVGDVEYKNGEYWVYVSGRTRELSIFADGFVKLSYTFPILIEKASVYILSLSSKSGGFVENGKGSLLITSKPENIKVSIDGFPDLKKTTPCSFENYRADLYKFKFYRNRYHTFDTIIGIEKNTQKQINIELMPTWGNLLVNTGLTDVEFLINKRKHTGSNLSLEGEIFGLAPGTYPLLISKKNYEPIALDIVILEAKTAAYNIELVPIKTNIEITSVPGGANVFIDGILQGPTPLRKEVIIGIHSFKITRDRYLDETFSLVLEEGKTTKKEVELRNHTKIKINSSPGGAKVSINGIHKGKTPITIEVSTGINKIEITKENYIPLTKNLDIKSLDNYSFDLQKKKFKLNLKSNPGGGTIKINKKEMGQTPKEIELEYGKYNIQVDKKGYSGASRNIKMDKNATVMLNLSRSLEGLMGLSYAPQRTDYDLYKAGFEIGWTYKKAKRLLSTFTYNYGWREDDGVKLSGVYKIKNSAYENLIVNHLDIKGIAEQKVYNYYVKIAYVFPKPFVFSISANAGANSISGYNVYVADKNYQSTGYPQINKGDEFLDASGKFTHTNLIYGFGLTIPFGQAYFSADYFISNNNINYGPVFVFGFGMALKGKK